jgi:CheY-like chemotaxis protein
VQVKGEWEMDMQILIVDDDEDDRFILREAFETTCNFSIECVEAVDGKDALHLLSSSTVHPDFIFLDINMPRINGLKLLRLLKKDERFKDIPVVMYTTSKRNEDKQEASKLGACYFITKPELLTDLQAEIAFVLEKKWVEFKRMGS